MLGQLASKGCIVSSRPLLSNLHLQTRFLGSKSYNLASPPNGFIQYKAGSWGSVQASGVAPDDLEVYPNFLDAKEQEILLEASLRKLDGVSTLKERRRKTEYFKANRATANTGFLPDAAYSFQDRHFDGVISGYRETTLTDWPAFPDADTKSTLEAVLAKIYSLIPDRCTAPSQSGELASPAHLITHLLHLSSEGYILPHVDNIQASAGKIAGVCLGTTRSLVLRKKAGEGSNDAESDTTIRVKLNPGCAYLQRGRIRYEWEHSIPLFDAEEDSRGQRLSVMIRDRLRTDG